MARRFDRPARSHPAPDDLIFGVNPVLEALAGRPDELSCVLGVAGARSAAPVIDAARRQGVAVELTDHATLERLTHGGHHQGVAARTRPFRYVAVEELLARAAPLLVALDGITDPQNLGAIIRSAEVLGAGGIILPKDRAAHVTATAIRASAGAAIHLPAAQVVNLVRALEQAKQAGYWTVALDEKGTQRFQDLPSLDRVLMLVGSEGRGSRRLVLEQADFRIAIPVRGRVGSLNAAGAAAIGLHELAQRVLSPTRAKDGGS